MEPTEQYLFGGTTCRFLGVSYGSIEAARFRRLISTLIFHNPTMWAWKIFPNHGDLYPLITIFSTYNFYFVYFFDYLNLDILFLVFCLTFEFSILTPTCHIVVSSSLVEVIGIISCWTDFPLVALVINSRVRSCLRLTLRVRCGKRVTNSTRLQVGSWNIGTLIKKSK